MSYVEKFIILNNLQPADAILLNKKFIGMLNHFAVYLGRHPQNNVPIFAANHTNGVQLLYPIDVDSFLEKLEPTKIERFYGSVIERKNAIKRALSRVGDSSYHLIYNNCEHYKNFVQFNQKYSPQVESVGQTLMVGGGIAAIAGLLTGNKNALGWGALSFLLGCIASNAANKED
jgi:Lecithin retinol acyltransferase